MVEWGGGGGDVQKIALEGSSQKNKESTGSNSSTEKRNCSFSLSFFFLLFRRGGVAAKLKFCGRIAGGGGEGLSRVYKMREAPSPFPIKDKRPL